jgi:hypothetical protein
VLVGKLVFFWSLLDEFSKYSKSRWTVYLKDTQGTIQGFVILKENSNGSMSDLMKKLFNLFGWHICFYFRSWNFRTTIDFKVACDRPEKLSSLTSEF